MLILILIDVTFEKGSNGQIHSFSDSHHPTKNPPSVKSPIPPPRNAIWKTLGLNIKKFLEFQIRLPKNHVSLPS